MTNIVSKVLNNQDSINTLTFMECHEFLADGLIHNKRSPGLKEVKELVRDRITVLNHQMVVERNGQKLLDTIKCSYDRLKNVWKDIDPERTDEYIQRHARSLSNDIHDLPHVPLGLMSKTAIKGNDDVTNEHFHSRQNAGSMIVRTALNRENLYTLKQHFKLLFEFSQVVFTTKKENGELMKFQKTGVFQSPRNSYEEAGIELVRITEYVIPETWAQVFKDLDILELEPYDFDI